MSALIKSTHIYVWEHIYYYICKIDSQWEFAVCLRELKPGLCDNIEGGMEWEVGREVENFKRRGHMYAYLSLIHVAV